jgi:hypothetical protein
MGRSLVIDSGAMAKKNPAAVELGRKGGKAVAERLGSEGMAELGKRGMRSRWEGTTPEERRAATAKARAAQKKRARKK